jgi:myo-inositol-1(or 4)-monophosphatase
MPRDVDPRLAREVAVRAAREAGVLVLDASGRLREGAVRHKGEKDLVTEMDERAQEMIVSALLREFPDHGVFAEEAVTGDRDAEYVWVIDPIDGTTNYVHGYPLFSVSIGLERRGVPVAAVVHAPAMNETFEAHAGGGATLNGRAIQVSAAGALIDSLLATGFACVRDDLLDNNLAIFERIVRRVQGVRRGGSAALDLAYVAAGRFDGFWELNLSRWDTSAGVLLVREAGGVVTDFEGDARFVEKREIAASNGALHEALLGAIRDARAGKRAQAHTPERDARATSGASAKVEASNDRGAREDRAT